MIERIHIKRSARDVLLKERRSPNVFLVAGLYIIIIMILSIIRTYLTDYSSIFEMVSQNTLSGTLTTTDDVTRLITPRGIVFYIITGIISVIIGLGFDIYILQISRGQSGGFWTLFKGFEYFFKYLIMYIIMNIIIGASTLLFIVPGVYVAILFSQVKFIMIDNRDKSIIDCLKGSMELVKGYKLDVFMLFLSLMPWLLLGSLAEMYAGNAGILAYIWIYPYTRLISAKYYDALREKKEQSYE